MKRFLVLFLLLFTYVFATQAQDKKPDIYDIVFMNTRPAPKADDCGCNMFVAYKQTNKTTREGKVTVYEDVLVFSFGTYVKQFNLAKNYTGIWMDDDGDIYLLRSTQDGRLYITVSSTNFIIDSLQPLTGDS